MAAEVVVDGLIWLRGWTGRERWRLVGLFWRRYHAGVVCFSAADAGARPQRADAHHPDHGGAATGPTSHDRDDERGGREDGRRERAASWAHSLRHPGGHCPRAALPVGVRTWRRAFPPPPCAGRDNDAAGSGWGRRSRAWDGGGGREPAGTGRRSWKGAAGKPRSGTTERGSAGEHDGSYRGGAGGRAARGDGGGGGRRKKKQRARELRRRTARARRQAGKPAGAAPRGNLPRLAAQRIHPPHPPPRAGQPTGPSTSL